jgi:hypothetical protein
MSNLSNIDEEAKALCKPEKPISLCFDVKGGPVGVLKFADGKCELVKGKAPSNILIKLGSPDKFNGVINGTVTPIPIKGITKVGFLTKNFQGLAKILSKYLKATPEQLADKSFMVKSTTLMFYVIAEAVAAIGNNDKIGKISAKRIPDGTISFEIIDGPAASIVCKGGELTVKKEKAVNPRAKMELASIEIARGLFSGKEDSIALIGNGLLKITGYIPMVDNLNRILGRVAEYLA